MKQIKTKLTLAVIVIGLAVMAEFFFNGRSADDSASRSEMLKHSQQTSSEADPTNQLALSPPANRAVLGDSLLDANPRSPSSTVDSGSFSIERFKVDFPGEWEIARTPNGQVQAVAGGLTPFPTGLESESQQALTLAKRFAAHFATGEVFLQPAVESQKQTLAQRAYRFEQMHEGFAVYHGGLSFYATNSAYPGERRVGLVTNDLKPISTTDRGPALSSSKAAEEYENGDQGNGKVLSISGPVYFVVGARAVPAYKAVVKRSTQSFEEEVVIDGNSGRALHRQSLGMH